MWLNILSEIFVRIKYRFIASMCIGFSDAEHTTDLALLYITKNVTVII